MNTSSDSKKYVFGKTNALTGSSTQGGGFSSSAPWATASAVGQPAGTQATRDPGSPSRGTESTGHGATPKHQNLSPRAVDSASGSDSGSESDSASALGQPAVMQADQQSGPSSSATKSAEKGAVSKGRSIAPINIDSDSDLDADSRNTVSRSATACLTTNLSVANAPVRQEMLSADDLTQSPQGKKYREARAGSKRTADVRDWSDAWMTGSPCSGKSVPPQQPLGAVSQAAKPCSPPRVGAVSPDLGSIKKRRLANGTSEICQTPGLLPPSEFGRPQQPLNDYAKNVFQPYASASAPVIEADATTAYSPPHTGGVSPDLGFIKERQGSNGSSSTRQTSTQTPTLLPSIEFVPPHQRLGAVDPTSENAFNAFHSYASGSAAGTEADATRAYSPPHTGVVSPDLSLVKKRRQPSNDTSSTHQNPPRALDYQEPSQYSPPPPAVVFDPFLPYQPFVQTLAYQGPSQFYFESSDTQLVTSSPRDLETILEDEIAGHVYERLIDEQGAQIRDQVEAQIWDDVLDGRAGNIRTLALERIRREIHSKQRRSEQKLSERMGVKKHKKEKELEKELRTQRRRMHRNLEDEETRARALMEVQLRDELTEQARRDTQADVDKMHREAAEVTAREIDEARSAAMGALREEIETKKNVAKTRQDEEYQRVLNGGFEDVHGDLRQLAALAAKVNGALNPPPGGADEPETSNEESPALPTATADKVVTGGYWAGKRVRRGEDSHGRNDANANADESTSGAQESLDSPAATADTAPPNSARSMKRKSSKEDLRSQYAASEPPSPVRSESAREIKSASKPRGQLRTEGVWSSDSRTAAEAAASGQRGVKRSRDDADTPSGNPAPVAAGTVPPQLGDTNTRDRPVKRLRSSGSGAHGPKAESRPEEPVDLDAIWAAAELASGEMGLDPVPGEEDSTLVAEEGVGDVDEGSQPVNGGKEWWNDVLLTEKRRIRTTQEEVDGSLADEDDEEEEL